MIAKSSKRTVLTAMVAVLLTVAGCGGGARAGELRSESQALELSGGEARAGELPTESPAIEPSGGESRVGELPTESPAIELSGGEVRVGELRTESQTVELNGTTPVHIVITMGAGDLVVTGGATALLDAYFTYNVAELKPEIDYSGSTLSVRTPDVRVGAASLLDLNDYLYMWALRLNDDVPMDMQVSVGAGLSALQLGSLSLAKLEVAGGAGELTVDLTGDWQNDLEATIEGGLGNRTVILPANVGVRVKAEVGVGSVNTTGLTKDGEYYVNSAYGQSDVTLNIQVMGGVGGTDLIVRE